MTNFVDETDWQRRALIAEASERNLMQKMRNMREEINSLKRRLQSSESELDLAVDQLEATNGR